jgi:hypothetical protein
MEDHGKTIRAMIEHENHLVNYRLTWLITLQGLLFAALGFAWDKRDAWQIIMVFCVMGIFSAVSCLVSLSYTQRAIYRLEKWWETHKPERHDGPEVIGFPLSQVALLTLPWLILLVLFIGGWTAIFVINLIRA